MDPSVQVQCLRNAEDRAIYIKLKYNYALSWKVLLPSRGAYAWSYHSGHTHEVVSYCTTRPTLGEAAWRSVFDSRGFYASRA